MTDVGALSAADLDALGREAAQPAQSAALERDHEVDVAWQIPNVGRCRASVFRQRDHRPRPASHSRDDSGRSTRSACRRPSPRSRNESRGLVVVTGATGSGKSTTLAAIIDRINRTRAVHILTIEDPIEFVHTDAMAVISQREIGVRHQSYATGLASDVIASLCAQREHRRAL
jgi:Tfp pilus assembly pilus retraction ATPase PilT